MGKKYRATTFLELIIYMSITAILSAAAFVGYQNSKSNAKLAAAQAEVASTIKTAQNYALQGKIQPGETVCGYGFGFVAGLEEYKIYYISLDRANFPDGCGEQNNDPAYRQLHFGFYGIVESYKLPEDVFLDNTATSISDTNIFFDIPNGNIYKEDGDPLNAPVTIQFEISGKTEKITLNERGLITEN